MKAKMKEKFRTYSQESFICKPEDLEKLKKRQEQNNTNPLKKQQPKKRSKSPEFTNPFFDLLQCDYNNSFYGIPEVKIKK